MILSDYIRTNAERVPENVALVSKEGKITYRELEDRILKCAQGLSILGVKKGTTFALVLRNCPEFIVLSMALSKLGAIAVPINFLEKGDRIELILNDAKAEGIITAKEFLRNVQQAAENTPTLKYFFLRDGEQNQFKSFSSLIGEKKWSGDNDVTEEDLMMLLYTSGTTGLPKGVMLTHKNFSSNVDQCLAAIQLSAQDRFLCLLPLFHAFSWTACFLIPMKLGTMTVIIESLLPFDPVIKAIWENKVTLFVGVPQIFAALGARIQGVKAFLLRQLNPVRACISGAAPLQRNIHLAFEKSLGTPLLEGYGLTEAAPVVTLNPLEKRKVGSVGKPLPGVELSLRDDQGHPTNQGEVGEIWVRGANVMKGYYKKPDETRECLTKDGWLITGDMGQLDEEGYLTIVDRKKDLIIVKGLNVYPQEVENVIALDPGIKEVAVVGKVEKETGDEIIRAFVTIKEGASIEKSKLFDLCRKHLAAYKMPKEFIVLDEMPKNALQKILKKELRKRP
ncbi:MAG: Long-chain-fatty-acid--CoA ligase [Elusimicrobia bacterium]|nr:Long-chain-fatty-acid--CoA ligase [Elusimicrobiota bacterium]